MNRRTLSFITLIGLSLILVGCGTITTNEEQVNENIFNYIDAEVEGYYDFECCEYEGTVKDEQGIDRVDFGANYNRIKEPTDDVLFINKELDGIFNSLYDLATTTFKDECIEFSNEVDIENLRYAVEIQNTVMYNTKDIVVIEFNAYEYRGGAHGTNAVYALLFDIPNQKQIMFSDVFDENKLDELQKIISQKLLYLKDNGELDLFDDYYDSINMIFDEHANNFYITKEGVSFIFNQYLVAPYSEGIFNIDFTFDELEGIVKFDLSRLQ